MNGSDMLGKKHLEPFQKDRLLMGRLSMRQLNTPAQTLSPWKTGVVHFQSSRNLRLPWETPEASGRSPHSYRSTWGWRPARETFGCKYREKAMALIPWVEKIKDFKLMLQIKLRNLVLFHNLKFVPIIKPKCTKLFQQKHITRFRYQVPRGTEISVFR